MDSTTAEILLYLAVVASAIVAGAQLFCALAVVPAFGDWPDKQGVHVHQAALSERPHTYLKRVSPVAILSGVAAIVVGWSTDPEVILAIVGVVFSVAQAAISSREWPINREIDDMGPDPTAEQVERYTELRKTWDKQHIVRSYMSMAAFLCFAAAAALF